MKVIARIICWQNVFGIDGIPGDSIKIDDAIKGAAFPDPLIDCLTFLFLYLIVVTIEWVAVERRDPGIGRKALLQERQAEQRAAPSCQRIKRCQETNSLPF